MSVINSINIKDKIKENKDFYEKAIILEALFGKPDEEEKIAEIETLLKATKVEHFSTICQNIREINPATIFGQGKLLEIKEIIKENDVNLVVFDGEFTPSQQNNVSDILEVKVINRTTLILDIFASNALSDEGKILVELAQLRYNYSRLSGKGYSLSRLGGGIGTRGPGESKLETDRRHIKVRIDYLERKLKEIEKRRSMQLDRRKKNGVKTIALVGYTNTGKSTLLNLLTDSDVLAENKLFATLDPTARKTTLNGFDVVLVDTVGFVKELPHDLLDAFKSTLECAVEADLILNVCDVTSNWNMQNESTEKTLTDLKVTAPIINVANKCDQVESLENLPSNFIYISALKNKGIERLKDVVCEKLFSDLTKHCFTFDYGKPIDLNKLKKMCYFCEANYTNENIFVNAVVSKQNETQFFKELKKQELI